MTKRIRVKDGTKLGVFLIDVPKAVLKRLGALPDTELSRQTGYSVAVLRRRRKALGVPVFSRVNLLKTSRHALTVIQANSVRSAAGKLGISRTAVQKVRDELGLGPAPIVRPRTTIFPKALMRQLGKTYDTILARQYGFARTTVRQERQRQGIPGMPNDKGRNRVELPVHILKRLGKDYGNRLAKESGHCYQTIAHRRKELGIRSYRPKALSRCRTGAKIVERIIACVQIPGVQPKRSVCFQASLGNPATSALPNRCGRRSVIPARVFLR